SVVTRDEYNYVLPIWSKKAFHMPLPILTVAAMIPQQYQVKLIDLNIQQLSDDDLLHAELVFLTGMITQKKSIDEILQRCSTLKIPSVLGGPYASSYEGEIPATCIVRRESEEVIPQLFRDYEQGKLKKIYQGSTVDLSKSPCPRFDLIEPDKYLCALLQFSRGCIYKCDFCDIPWHYDNTQRAKKVPQFLNELDALYKSGFRGWVELADSNLLTNKEKKVLLKEIIKWQHDKGHPFIFRCQASINVAQDNEMLDLMSLANFRTIFIGIETPVVSALREVNKVQNTRVDLLDSIDKVQTKGLQIDIGTVIGFDSDPSDIFEIQENFITNARVIISLMSLLGVLNHTPLYERMKKENRLLFQANADRIELNFESKMDRKVLLKGFADLYKDLYTPENYFKRCYAFLQAYNAGYAEPSYRRSLVLFTKACIAIMPDRYSYHYVVFIIKVMFRHPKKILKGIDLGIWGYQHYKIADDIAQRTQPDIP
ncbi:DUF4070 domain-containing protein, partial [Desulfobulbus sp. TB]|nr:DUF4070 domain-containing protein [Desulfobulbus sp. TB]